MAKDKGNSDQKKPAGKGNQNNPAPAPAPVETPVAKTESGYNPESGLYDKPKAEENSTKIAMEKKAAEAETIVSENVETIDPNAPAPEVAPSNEDKPKAYEAPVKPHDAYNGPQLEAKDLSTPSNPNVWNPAMKNEPVIVGEKEPAIISLAKSMQAIIETELQKVPKMDRQRCELVVESNPMVGGVLFHNNPENENEAAVLMFTPHGYACFQNLQEPGEGLHCVRIPEVGFFDLGPGVDFLDTVTEKMKELHGDGWEEFRDAVRGANETDRMKNVGLEDQQKAETESSTENSTETKVEGEAKSE